MDASTNRTFAPDVPMFKMRIVKSADHDGVYVIYKTNHFIVDGLSMIKILSRMQDGGIEADKITSAKVIERPDLTWS